MAATKKAADSTLYHLASKGFWKKFRDAVVVNPEISTGLPLPSLNRNPQPASRPEKYNTPATKASDPAQNPYWKRDVRRAYPQLSVVTQLELSSLLIEHAQAPSVAAPVEGETAVAEVAKEIPDLSAAIATVTSEAKVYTESKLPPVIPTSYKRWVPKRSPDAPHDPTTFFPLKLYA
ncbi:hypothetical protein ONZ45_g8019 [Pleurotus djamor]|nr:hypothetical protein ONZ45_g8019 [Pleurotus djamor]